MQNLSQKTCEVCKVGSNAVSQEAKTEYLKVIPDWDIVEEVNVEKLQREFIFKNFVDALAFTNKVGEIAEDESHHPDITTRYGSVTVVWYTHKIMGLHINDFIMATKTDGLFSVT
jgi:4a-hydroxytetrahydrobiopterin dehydratase